ncbi:MAG TPA: ABC transporter ATP-binding protein [Candidatus Methylomirabilis sp.]|nr:ABC transporter ATP-binding protein [Candidatus Methylomirabilis sp.]
MSTPNAIIEVHDLVTQYGARRILDGASLRVPEGLVTVILGGSGSGKSTLLRHLIGLQKPTGGQILVKGRDLAPMTPDELVEMRKRMGILFQGGALFNSMTVGENVALPLREHTRLEESTIQIMTRIKLQLVGLAGFEDFMPAQLSGGMKKRAGLARAIAMDPEILFFDEPSAGLDPLTAAALDELILKLKQTFRMTILVVTHELPSVFAIADHVVMLMNGKVLMEGGLDALRASPDPRIQDFLARRPAPESEDAEAYLRSLVGT